MKNFDDIFSNKVKEAFDSYNADPLAEEGWDSYLRKYGRKRRQAIVIPLWTRAAAIAVIVTIGVLFTGRLNNLKIGEPVNQIAQESRSELTKPAINKEDTAATKQEITASKPEFEYPGQAPEATVGKTIRPPQAGRGKTGYQVYEGAIPAMAETVKATKSTPSGTVNTDGMLSAEAVKASRSYLSENVLSEGSPPADSSIAARSLLAKAAMAEVSLSPWTAESAEMSAEMNLPDHPAEVSMIDDADTGLKLKPKETPQVYGAIPREKMTTTIMTGLSGMIASISNSTSTARGVSIGLYMEQQITRRISVRPGLAMAKHIYTIESSSGVNPAMDYTAPELNGMPGKTTSYDADIDIVSMEVPVNFVFSLWKRPRSNLFVTTGASTVVYLSQHMSANFNNTYTKTTVDANTGNVTYTIMTTSAKIDSEQELSKRVDFMGLANFSTGHSLPFGRNTHLLFEPFVQLPIKDLTSLNLRIMYGGLSMKVQF